MSTTIVIFGASGDLTSRKLIPALFELYRKGRLPENTRVVGFSRTRYSDDEWRKSLLETTSQFAGSSFCMETWMGFAPCIHYHPGDISQEDDFRLLDARLRELEDQEEATRVYYLSTAPRFYAQAVAQLGRCGMADEEQGGPRRAVIEKPFGVDLESAQHLNKEIHEVFDEHQVYRIDHYLGKETVNNVMVLRFANTIFEPVWNRNYIDHVQITAAEEVIVGRRAPYYESAGILRDMFQNHLMQLFTLTAMEAPCRFDATAIRDEKVKVLRAVRKMEPGEIAVNTLRGQYRKYRDEEGVAENSQTETFAALRLDVDNWRWQGVPFYLRSGKAMSCRTTQIVIQFRFPPHMMFPQGPRHAQDANRLLIQIQPAEGIQLHFQTKVPDTSMQLRMTELDFNFKEHFRGEMPEAYQRLLLDAMEGDPGLFSRSDEVELAWGLIDPIQEAWDAGRGPELHFYEAGGWGPAAAVDWMRAQQGRQWFDMCPVLR